MEFRGAARRLLQRHENSVASADGFRANAKEKQIPPAKTACGITIGAFFCEVCWLRRRGGSGRRERVARGTAKHAHAGCK
jgi:hypothetical protein